MASMSASEMSPILSTPSTKPALFTACRSQPQNPMHPTSNAQRHTKNIDIAKVLWDLVNEGRDLGLVGDIELDSGKLPALLEARLLVCSCAGLSYRFESLRAARGEDEVRATLFEYGKASRSIVGHIRIDRQPAYLRK